MVDTFFLETLPNQERAGMFLLTDRAIGENGIAPGERLVFTYQGECVYRARAESARQPNDVIDKDKYPFLFFVNIASIEAVEGTLEELQAKLKYEGLQVPNLVKSRSWPKFRDDEPAARIIDAYVAPDQSADEEVEQIALETLENHQAKGQGFLLNTKLRGQLEKYAMDAAEAYFTSEGFACQDRSKSKPYDFHCSRGKQQVVYLEVKGTQTNGEQIILTNGEVEFARSHKGQMALFILHSIRVTESAGDYHLSEGKMRLSIPWEVDHECLRPLSFMYRVQDD